MRRIVKTYIVLLLAGSLSLWGCSGSTIDYFQVNDALPSYELFSLLDDYPSLKEPFSNLDPVEFNDRMSAPINQDISLAKEVLGLTVGLLTHPQNPITDSMASLRRILQRIIEQDFRDDPDETYSNYAPDFFNYLDSLSASDPDVGKEVVSMLRKNVEYLRDTYDESAIEDVMSDLIAFLRDTDGQTLQSVLPLLQEGLAKLLMIANEDMEDDIALGNAVSGIDALLSGVNDIATGDAEARELLYDVIRSGGDIFTATAGGKNFATILKELMENLEEYATVGGGQFSNTNYNNDTSTYYVSTELRNGVKAMWPALAKLFIRAVPSWVTGKEDHSPIYDPDEGRSALEILAQNLYALKKNCDIDFSTYSVEDSLKRMVEYNAFGEKRSEASYQVSYLDHLLFMLAVSNDFGYLTRKASSSNEPYANDSNDDPNGQKCRLHGTPVDGCITVNDSLYSMTSGAILAESSLGSIGYFGSYNLALDLRVNDYTWPQKTVGGIAQVTVYNKGQGNYLYRSSTPFTSSQANNYKFYMGYDFPTLTLLSGASVGDVGIPNGGKTGITPTSNETTVGGNNDYRTYYPYVGNGLGELNTGRWVMGWIARACWEGEGPYYYDPEKAGKTAPTVDIDGTTYKVYYRPDGRIYALKNTNTGAFFYPVDGGNDVAETDSEYAPLTLGSYQLRENRYKWKWHTDYYLMKADYVCYDDDANHGGPRYYSPANVVGTTGINKYKMYSLNGTTGQGEYGDDLDASTTNAGALWFWEKIDEADANRACASQEEAMYRNFQWLILEKKFVFIMPMRSYLGLLASACGADFNINMDALVYAIIEGNGIAGVANAKKGSQLGYWSLSGSEGTALGHAQPTSGANYGDSHSLADGRVWILVKEDASWDNQTVIIWPMTEGDYVDINKVWNTVLASGNVLPNAVGANIAPIARMAFLQSDLVASNSSDIGNTSSSVWQNRNKLLPIVVALAGDLHGKSYYEPPASGNWYNFAGNHRYPLKHMRELLAMMVSPMTRYYKTPYTGASKGWWVPQIKDPHGQGTFAFFTPKPIDGAVNFYPSDSLKSMGGLLVESSAAAADGLIPALASTGTTSKLLALLQRLGASGGVYNDVDKTSSDYNQWGARRKVFYGLEQIITNIKASKSTELDRDYFGTASLYPDWMFTVDESRGDINLDTVLDEAIGTDALAKGLAVFVDYRDPSHASYKNWDWTNFNRMIAALGELSSANGTTAGKYSITEELVSVTDKLLTSFKATPAHLKALRHTLGIVVTEDANQDSTWEYPDDLSDVLFEELPYILEANAGHNRAFLDFASLFLVEGGFAEYVVDVMNSSYSFSEIIPDLYRFLGDELVANPNSPLWRDLADLLLDVTNVLGLPEPAWFDEVFQDNGPDFNKAQAYPGGAYQSLGEILSNRY